MCSNGSIEDYRVLKGIVFALSEYYVLKETWNFIIVNRELREVGYHGLEDFFIVIIN